MKYDMSGGWHLPLAVLFVLGQAVGIALILDNFSSPMLIWGGKECTAHGCFSAPPTGLILIYLSLALVELILPSMFANVEKDP